MRRNMLSFLLLLTVLQVSAQQVVQNKQRHFPKTVPAGNYSGITWIGDDRYAVANDKSQTAGFHLITIRIDSVTGIINEVQFAGGCNGNTQGVAALVKGRKAEEVIPLIENINCGGKGTSCPAQLAAALKEVLANK